MRARLRARFTVKTLILGKRSDGLSYLAENKNNIQFSVDEKKSQIYKRQKVSLEYKMRCRLYCVTVS